jgi:hypothetical protein
VNSNFVSCLFQSFFLNFIYIVFSQLLWTYFSYWSPLPACLKSQKIKHIRNTTQKKTCFWDFWYNFYLKKKNVLRIRNWTSYEHEWLKIVFWYMKTCQESLLISKINFWSVGLSWFVVAFQTPYNVYFFEFN